MLGIEILVKKYHSIATLNGYLEIAIFYPDFSLAKDRKREWHSRVQTRYRKIVGEWKDIKSDFYANDSPNDDLKSEL